MEGFGRGVLSTQRDTPSRFADTLDFGITGIDSQDGQDTWAPRTPARSFHAEPQYSGSTFHQTCGETSGNYFEVTVIARRVRALQLH